MKTIKQKKDETITEFVVRMQSIVEQTKKKCIGIFDDYKITISLDYIRKTCVKCNFCYNDLCGVLMACKFPLDKECHNCEEIDCTEHDFRDGP